MLTSSCAELRDELRRQLRDNAYPGYVYGYPHKKAYRALSPARDLEEVWGGEDCDHLLCYVHIPFCTQRCSFCNLFTYVPGDESPTSAYLEALGREMVGYAKVLEVRTAKPQAAERQDARFTRLYLGGGTPTYLSTRELMGLVGALRSTLGVEPDSTHGCIEASPETLDEEKVEALAGAGFQRISLGVQTLVEDELRQVNRRFDFALHRDVIALIGRAGFPHFNIDLIYGLPGQTTTSWRYSLEQAIDSPATSLFLYPLYIRPLTGLGARQRSSLEHFTCPTTHQMTTMYDHAVERLTGAGFRQRSMRQFRRDGGEDDGEYRCQQHGTVGLGAGARSYTSHLHYSTPWKMVARNIRGVIEAYVEQMRAGEMRASHGFVLDDDERRRRFIIQSLLLDGLDVTAFAQAFGVDGRERFAVLWEALDEEGLIEDSGAGIRLTARGVRHADIVGQVFFSPRVKQLMTAYEYDT
jgi:oxygen-independent coproporphyrinogen-3 oxidase